MYSAVVCFGVVGALAVPKVLTACAKYRIDLKRSWKEVKCAVPGVGRTLSEQPFLVSYKTLAISRGPGSKLAKGPAAYDSRVARQLAFYTLLALREP